MYGRPDSCSALLHSAPWLQQELFTPPYLSFFQNNSSSRIVYFIRDLNYCFAAIGAYFQTD